MEIERGKETRLGLFAHQTLLRQLDRYARVYLHSSILHTPYCTYTHIDIHTIYHSESQTKFLLDVCISVDRCISILVMMHDLHIMNPAGCMQYFTYYCSRDPSPPPLKTGRQQWPVAVPTQPTHNHAHTQQSNRRPQFYLATGIFPVWLLGRQINLSIQSATFP
jgi:hypothetical protein